jgi:hypothetical protein
MGFLLIFGFVIEHTVAEALKIRVRHLLPKFLTDALVFLDALDSAGTIPAGALQALADGIHHGAVWV